MNLAFLQYRILVGRFSDGRSKRKSVSSGAYRIDKKNFYNLAVMQDVKVRDVSVMQDVVSCKTIDCS